LSLCYVPIWDRFVQICFMDSVTAFVYFPSFELPQPTGETFEFDDPYGVLAR
jgi:hypothetical protein